MYARLTPEASRALNADVLAALRVQADGGEPGWVAMAAKHGVNRDVVDTRASRMRRRVAAEPHVSCVACGELRPKHLVASKEFPGICDPCLTGDGAEVQP